LVSELFSKCYGEEMAKGILVLDIDGTAAAKDGVLTDKAALYFEQKQKEGWLLAFFTGRIFPYAVNALGKLRVPYTLAVQNGADILLMPENKVIHRTYFLRDTALDIAKEFEKHHFVLYAGYDQGDFCYYNPSNFSKEMEDYLHKLQSLTSSDWVPVSDFSTIEQKAFPLLKGIGDPDHMDLILSRILKNHDLSGSVIGDPIEPMRSLLLIGAEDATKGHALDAVLDYYGIDGPSIGAGDDRNDVPLLQKVNIPIVMSTAPDDIQKIGRLIAESATKDGVLDAIDQAIDEIDRS